MYPENVHRAALVIHGGTIMNIMEEYADRQRPFYEWHVKNGGGYLIELDPVSWQKGKYDSGSAKHIWRDENERTKNQLDT